MSIQSFQITVIGGGINGTGIARESISRGFSTLLLEKNDFAHATSGNSSKLIHGGIRYLENAEFKLVQESLKERKILLNTAPHLVTPLRLNIPVYGTDKRPPWMVWSGCKMYDLFAGSDNMESSRKLSDDETHRISILNQDDLKGIVQYSDGQTRDARLTVETALSAQEYGADVRNYHELIKVESKENSYLLTILDKTKDETYQVSTKYLINAAGPWVPAIDKTITKKAKRPGLKYVRGIHFVVPKIQEDETGFLILPSDGRVVFVLPWIQNYTLIGTTESNFEGDDFDVIPSSNEEEQYLLETFNQFFPSKKISMDDVVYKYSGVRSLVDYGEDNMSAISREYVIEEENLGEDSGYLAVFGGKITTYRSLSNKMIDKVSKRLDPEFNKHHNTEIEPLFGGYDINHPQQDEVKQKLKDLNLDPSFIDRWQMYYGSRWIEIANLAIADPKNQKTIAIDGYLRAELVYNVTVEKARDLEDVILRRTKLIYELNQDQKNIIENEIKNILA
ncbi:MAG: glycerol-3-phosphate dehydrogenase [Candidatus Cloacimonadota bacterium]|nr:MAG: glycerol-3-phosphate dehydrogenase [Candidatus Cloacimonadota bacterium]